jgi:UDP-N-acetylglucosamine transferase subunit ALG13
MIFVTVGTVLSHDALIEKIDALKALLKIEDKIYAQIGNGKYIPQNMKYLRFVGNMDEAYKRADIVISSCGASTIFEVMAHGKKLIVVQNPGITSKHEWELVSKLEEMGCLIWCKNISNLLNYIQIAKTKTFKKFESNKFDASAILEMIEGRS